MKKKKKEKNVASTKKKTLIASPTRPLGLVGIRAGMASGLVGIIGNQP